MSFTSGNIWNLVHEDKGIRSGELHLTVYTNYVTFRNLYPMWWHALCQMTFSSGVSFSWPISLILLLVLWFFLWRAKWCHQCWWVCFIYISNGGFFQLLTTWLCFLILCLDYVLEGSQGTAFAGLVLVLFIFNMSESA